MLANRVPLYRDADLLALDKPSGVSLFADRSGADNLWDQLKVQLSSEGIRPLSVHRIDKGTSGVLLVALNRDTQRELNRAFNHGAVSKYYLARVSGDLALTRTGVIDLPLRRGRKNRYRVAGARDAIHRDADRWSLRGDPEPGFRSLTRLRRLAAAGSDTLVALAPRTGRTHQLRVHLAWIGHPIRGDHLYGRPDTPDQRWPRLALHCHRLAFRIGATPYALTARVPEGFTAASD